MQLVVRLPQLEGVPMNSERKGSLMYMKKTSLISHQRQVLNNAMPETIESSDRAYKKSFDKFCCFVFLVEGGKDAC